jgi:hypothetical protein
MRTADAYAGKMPYRLERHELQRELQLADRCVGIAPVGGQPSAAQPRPR